MNILVVEDDFISRRLLCRYLENAGKCDVAINGDEAVAAVHDAIHAENPYVLICLDIMMPGMSGQEALTVIRQIESEHGLVDGKGARVIMTTSLEDRDHGGPGLPGVRRRLRGQAHRKAEAVQVLDELGLRYRPPADRAISGETPPGPRRAMLMAVGRGSHSALSCASGRGHAPAPHPEDRPRMKQHRSLSIVAGRGARRRRLAAGTRPHRPAPQVASRTDLRRLAGVGARFCRRGEGTARTWRPARERWPVRAPHCWAPSKRRRTRAAASRSC